MFEQHKHTAISSEHHPMMHENTAREGYAAKQIHPEGLYRWKEFADRIPFSRETWRKRVLAGTAPSPQNLGSTCTAWRGADILAWLKNPNTFRQSINNNGKEDPSAY